MKKIIPIGVCAVLLIAFAVGLIWWHLPTAFLADVAPEDVARIEVFCGATGQSFTIEDAADIEYIVTKIADVQMRRVEWEQKDGFVYSLSFWAADGSRIVGFLLNGPASVRDGDIEYEPKYETEEDALCFEYIKSLEPKQ